LTNNNKEIITLETPISNINMERRFAIKQILIMAGGIALLPSCLKEAGKSSIALNNLDVSLDQEMLLGEIAETIIPATDTPGAKQLNLHLFVLKMLDDLYEKEDQKLFMKGLSDFSDSAQDKYGKSFQKLNVAQRQERLLAIENDKQAPPAIGKFYEIMKSRTVGGYLNSKYVMSNLIKWELVPGRYNGYFPVKAA
jgi:hypothetical protein